MASCAHCDTYILIGGSRDGERRYCNSNCLEQSSLARISDEIPPDVLAEHITGVHQGWCPECSGPGPVDVHTSREIYSVLLVSSWENLPNLCCRRCGVKDQLGALTFSFFLGWWSFPWGLVMTPVQVTRNLVGLLSPPNPSQPSEQLDKLVRMSLASSFDAESQVQAAAKPRGVEALRPPPSPPAA